MRLTKNMRVENVIIQYRDRPAGSESKLNTYSDGIKVIMTIVKLYKNYKPLGFFYMDCSGACAGFDSFPPDGDERVL